MHRKPVARMSLDDEIRDSRERGNLINYAATKLNDREYAYVIQRGYGRSSPGLRSIVRESMRCAKKTTPGLHPWIDDAQEISEVIRCILDDGKVTSEEVLEALRPLTRLAQKVANYEEGAA